MSKSYALAVLGFVNRLFINGIDQQDNWYRWTSFPEHATKFGSPQDAIAFLERSSNSFGRGKVHGAITIVRITETPGKETRRIVPVEGAPFIAIEALEEEGGGFLDVFDQWNGVTPLGRAWLFADQHSAMRQATKKITRCKLVGVAVTSVEPTITVEEIE